MNPKLKRKIKLFIPALIIVPIFLVLIVWALEKYAPPKKYTLNTEKGEYYHKLFKVRQPDGKYVPMVSVFWGIEKELTIDDISKILKALSNPQKIIVKYVLLSNHG